MKGRPYRCLGCLAVLFALFVVEPATAADARNSLVCVSTPDSPMYVVSIPAEKLLGLLRNGRRITGYKTRISEAFLCGVGIIPEDWWIKIEPYMEPYQIQATAGHGASWLDMHEIRRGAFDKFMVIRAFPKEGAAKSGPIRIRVDLSIDIPAEEKEKHEIISEKDMILVPYK